MSKQLRLSDAGWSAKNEDSAHIRFKELCIEVQRIASAARPSAVRYVIPDMRPSTAVHNVSYMNDCEDFDDGLRLLFEQRLQVLDDHTA